MGESSYCPRGFVISEANGEFWQGQWEVVVHNDAGCCMLFRRYQAEHQRTGCEYARLTCCIDLFYDQIFKLRLSELNSLKCKDGFRAVQTNCGD